MNYIKQLEIDNKALLASIDLINQQINDLRIYLNSEKFRCGNELDSYVNVSDVLLRLPDMF